MFIQKENMLLYCRQSVLYYRDKKLYIRATLANLRFRHRNRLMELVYTLKYGSQDSVNVNMLFTPGIITINVHLNIMILIPGTNKEFRNYVTSLIPKYKCDYYYTAILLENYIILINNQIFCQAFKITFSFLIEAHV